MRSLRKYFCIVAALLMMFEVYCPVYASEDKVNCFLEEADSFEIVLIDGNGDVVGSIEIDTDDILKNPDAVRTMNSISFEEWVFKAFGITSENIGKPITVKVEETQKTIPTVYSTRTVHTYSKTSTTYRTVTVTSPEWPNVSFSCEYYAHVTVRYTQNGNQITNVVGTGFSTESLTYGFFTENVSISNSVASDGQSCRATAKYLVCRYFEYLGIPYKFKKNCMDLVIAYSNEH